MRYKLTPQKEANEGQVEYLSRLAKFHNADCLVFYTLVVDKIEKEYRLSSVFYKKGDKEVSSQGRQTIPINQNEQLLNQAVKNFSLQLAGLLDLEQIPGQEAKEGDSGA